MGAALEFDGSIGVCRMWPRMFVRQPSVSHNPDVNSLYNCVRCSVLAATASEYPEI